MQVPNTHHGAEIKDKPSMSVSRNHESYQLPRHKRRILIRQLIPVSHTWTRLSFTFRYYYGRYQYVNWYKILNLKSFRTLKILINGTFSISFFVSAARENVRKYENLLFTHTYLEQLVSSFGLWIDVKITTIKNIFKHFYIKLQKT